MAFLLPILAAFILFTVAYLNFPLKSERTSLGIASLQLRLLNLCLVISKLKVVQFIDRIPSWRICCDKLAEQKYFHAKLWPHEATSALLLLIVVLSSAGIGLLAGELLIFFVALFVSIPIVIAIAHQIKKAKKSNCLSDMPAALRSLSSALQSGKTLAQAIAYVGSVDSSEISQAFADASMELSCSVPLEVALTRLAEKLPVQGIEFLISALSISQRTGSPLSQLLSQSASLMEKQIQFERKLSLKTTQVRFSIKIVCLLPCFLIGLLMLLSRDFRASALSGIGLTCLFVAAALDALAFLMVKKIMAGVLP